MRANVMMLALAAYAASACGGSQKPPKGHKPAASDVPYAIEIWVEDDPRLPKDIVFKGCAKWEAKKVTCVEASSKIFADIRVYADDSECVLKDDHGTPDDPKDDTTATTLAWAYSGGDIKMMMRCLSHKDGVYDAHQLAAVVTHEVGHQLGIWEHVPYPPKFEDALTHPDGRKVCGTAVMNPYYDEKIDYVTEIDALAFDLRDPKHSVLVVDVPRKDLPDCVYRAP
ncbi:MAG TPA: hypothetical protein VL283_02875 [Candidatus Baltobacteraceae bacterium]|nr:hypothetical protein [Candidatus Baltobacteraceae bacterium]